MNKSLPYYQSFAKLFFGKTYRSVIATCIVTLCTLQIHAQTIVTVGTGTVASAKVGIGNNNAKAYEGTVNLIRCTGTTDMTTWGYITNLAWQYNYLGSYNTASFTLPINVYLNTFASAALTTATTFGTYTTGASNVYNGNITIGTTDAAWYGPTALTTSYYLPSATNLLIVSDEGSFTTGTVEFYSTAQTNLAAWYSGAAAPVSTSAYATVADRANVEITFGAPVISTQPAATASFCSSSGNTTLNIASSITTSYQWQYSTTSGGTYTNVVNGTPAGAVYTPSSTAPSATATGSLQVSGITAAGTYYYRCIAYNGNGATSSTTSSTAAVTVTTCCTPPTTQASAAANSSVTSSTATVSWTNGNGAGRIVVAYPGATAGTPPSSGTSYTANTAYGSGTAIGTGYVVYNGTGSSVAVTGLSNSTQYTFVVYDYSGTTCYNTTVTAGSNTTTFTTLCTTPTITLGSIPAVCQGVTSTTLPYTATTGSPGTYSISWSSGATAAGFTAVSGATLPATPITITVPAAAAATTYTGTLTVTSGTSCTSSGYTISVTVNPAPTAVTVSGGGTFCGSATLTAGGGGGGTIYFQNMTNGGTSTATPSISQTVTATGTYYFNAEEGTCWGTQGSAAVTINTVPAAPTVSPTSSTICSGQSVGLTGTSAGNTINWYTVATGGTVLTNVASGTAYTVSPTTTTTYYAESKTSAGCLSATRTSVTVTVNPTPGAVTVSGGGTFCGSTTLTATDGDGYTIYWENMTINGTSTTTPSRSQTVTASGTYYFNEYNGYCWGTQGSAIVTINPIPAAPTSTSATPSAICAGQTSQITGTSTGNNINWWTAATGGTELTTVSSGTAYTVAPASTTSYYAESGALGSPVVVTNPTSPWTVPAGVTSITVDVWGGGGAGGGSTKATTSSSCGGGGGGGAFSTATLAVSPGQTYTISSTVTSGTGYLGSGGPAGTAGNNPGGAGGTITFSGTGGSCSATGGSGGGGAGNNGSGTAGPAGTTGTGTTIYAGGSGAAGSAANDYPGGGGGGGGSSSAGTAAVHCTNGTGGTGTYPGGAGGDNTSGCGSLSDVAGSPGTAPGGGGSGAVTYSNTTDNKAGGAGGAGQVIITYSLPTGCVSATRTPVTVTVNPAPGTVNVTGGGNYCGGTSAVLTASDTDGYQIYWQGTTSGGTSTATPSASQSVTASGTYYFNEYTGYCWGTQDSAIVVVGTIPAAPTVSPTSSTICLGQSAALTGTSAGNTINWYTTATGGTALTNVASGTAYTVFPASTTTYYAETQTPSNCLSATRTPVTVTVNPVPGAVTVSGGGTFCGSATLTATDGDGYTIYWQNTTSGGTSTATASSSQTVTATGTYYFNEYNGYCWGTQGSASVTIGTIPAAPTVSPTSASICGGTSVNITGTSSGNNINWWTAASGGTLDTTVASGSPYAVAPTTATTYYAEANTILNTSVVTISANGTWTVPAGVVSATVYLWGGGGGGGGSSATTQTAWATGGGGGGAACSVNTIAVSPGQVWTASIGAGGTGGTSSTVNGTPGGSTTFINGSTTLSAAGGSGGTSGTGTVNATHAGGAGGNTGTGTVYAGGAGSASNNGNDNAGGYAGGVTGTGGGAGGSGGAGTTPASSCVGAAAGGSGTYPGGAGGYNPDCGAETNQAGVTGSAPGGGGSGGNDWTTAEHGGPGAAGEIIIVYTVSPSCPSATRTPVPVSILPTPTAVTVSGGGPVCGSSATLTAGGGTGGTVYWQNTTSGGTSTATASSRQTVTASGTYYFNSYNGTCWGTQGSSIVSLIATPAAPTAVTASPASVCAGSSTDLTATSAGNNINWWTVATGGTLDTTVASGNQYQVAPAATTTYYAESATTPTSGTTTFTYTGAQQTWTVPSNVTSITVDVQGAAGGTGGSADVGTTDVGGSGGRIQGTIAVTPGQTLYINVGGMGGAGDYDAAITGAGGFNGGASGYQGGGGGGASDIRSGGTALSNRIFVAGGGGGAGYLFDVDNDEEGGPGGGLVGGAGYSDGIQGNGGYTGSGGTQSAGGAGGTFSGFCTANSGTLGAGGSDCSSSDNGGGGGGGGYYGGGGGVWSGGGGGSSWSSTSATAVTNTGGYQTGNGQITITYTPLTLACPSSTRVPVTVTVKPVPGAVTVAGGGTVCGSTTLTATDTDGYTIYWQNTTSGGTSTATPATSETITSPGTYYFNEYNGACWGTQGGTIVEIEPVPTAPTPVTATPSSICPGSSSLLNATSSGNNINWWTAATGGVKDTTVISGANFSVSPTVTTTYYAEASAISQYDTVRLTSSQSWTVPAGVTAATVYLWGGGGGGGGGSVSETNNYWGNGGAGGGGACSVNSIALTPGQVWTATVGAGGIAGNGATSCTTCTYATAGGTSTFVNGGTTLSATGGSPGIGATGTTGATFAGGAGGSTGTGTVYAGGAGSAGYNGNASNTGISATGGGGGGSAGAGTSPAEACGVTGTGGTGTFPGGNGGYNADCGTTAGLVGPPGSLPGGGGGGDNTYTSGRKYGGAGGQGQIIIVYPAPTGATGCPSATRTPVTVTVQPNATITLTSASGTNSQRLCGNTPITNITYSVSGGGTGAGVSGLPSGVTGAYSSGVYTISGSPATGDSGTYTYTVTTTGTCTQATASGTISVNPSPSSASITDVIEGCNGGHTATVSVTGGKSPYTFSLSCGSSYTEPSSALPYSLDAGGASSCNLTLIKDSNGCIPTTITGNPVTYPTRTLTTGNTQTCTIAANSSQTFFDASGNLMAEINAGTTALGSTTVITTIDGSVQKFGPTDQQSYLQRHFQITPATSAPANVCIYMSNAEVSALSTASASDDHNAPAYYQTFATNLTNANITQYDGGSETPPSHTSRTVITSYTATQNPTVDGATYTGAWQVCFNVGGFSGFYIHAANENADPLPVTLINFTATAINNQYIELNWATASEINNSGFQIERSYDGTNFTTIGWVEGHGNSQVTNNYQYGDMTVQPGVIYYYRLKQVDLDGNYTYTNIVSASLTGDKGFIVDNLFPNPASSNVSIGVISSVNASATIRMTDVLCRTVLESPWSLAIGYNVNDYDISTFAAGTYTVTLYTGTMTSTKKLVIAK